MNTLLYIEQYRHLKQEDFVAECVEQVLREMYIKNGHTYLITEGANITKLVSSFSKIAVTFKKGWKMIQKVVKSTKIARQFMKLCKGTLNVAPSLFVNILQGTKSNYKWVRLAKDTKSLGGVAINSGVKVLSLGIGKTQSYITEGELEMLTTICDVLKTLNDIILLVFKCVGVGAAIAQIVHYGITLILDTLASFDQKINSLLERCWWVLKKWLQDCFGINIDYLWDKFNKICEKYLGPIAQSMEDTRYDDHMKKRYGVEKVRYTDENGITRYVRPSYARRKQEEYEQKLKQSQQSEKADIDRYVKLRDTDDWRKTMSGRTAFIPDPYKQDRNGLYVNWFAISGELHQYDELKNAPKREKERKRFNRMQPRHREVDRDYVRNGNVHYVNPTSSIAAPPQRPPVSLKRK